MNIHINGNLSTSRPDSLNAQTATDVKLIADNELITQDTDCFNHKQHLMYEILVANVE